MSNNCKHTSHSYTPGRSWTHSYDIAVGSDIISDFYHKVSQHTLSVCVCVCVCVLAFSPPFHFFVFICSFRCLRQGLAITLFDSRDRVSTRARCVCAHNSPPFSVFLFASPLLLLPPSVSVISCILTSASCGALPQRFDRPKPGGPVSKVSDFSVEDHPEIPPTREPLKNVPSE